MMGVSPPCVLAVDDDEDFRALLELAWHGLGAASTLATVSSGAQAQRWIERHGPPAVITVDLDLDGESGLSLIRRLRAQAITAHVPVLVLSSASAQAEVTEAYAAGACGFVRKPRGVQPTATLLQAVRAFWLAQNVMAPAHSVVVERSPGLG